MEKKTVECAEVIERERKRNPVGVRLQSMSERALKEREAEIERRATERKRATEREKEREMLLGPVGPIAGLLRGHKNKTNLKNF